MAITFVGSDSDTQPSNTTTLNLTLPTHAADDFGIIYGRAGAGTVPTLAIGAASGWTELFQTNVTNGRSSVEAIWYKKFTSASETNPTVTIDVSEEHSASVHVFRGVDTTTPFDVTYTSASGQNTVNGACPAITPITDNGCYVGFQGVTHDEITASGLPTTPSSLTFGQQIKNQYDQQQHTIYLLDYGSAATITPSVFTHTGSGSLGDWRTYSIALRPQTDSSSTDELVVGLPQINRRSVGRWL